MGLLTDWAIKWNVSREALRDFQAIFTPEILSDEKSSEERVQSLVRLESVNHGLLWRNNAGGATDDTGRVIRYGLGNESPKYWKNWRSGDLVGITKIMVQPHHVGRSFGVFTMIEVKKPEWNPLALQQPSNERERAQLNCLSHVASLGGIAGFATSVSDYQRYIRDWSK